MARAALFLTDLFRDKILSHSGFSQDLPVGNLARPLPGEVAEQLEAQSNQVSPPGSAGYFEVSAKTAQAVYINEGSGAVTVQLTDGAYNAADLATEIQSKLNASGSLAGTYTVTYNVADRRFQVTCTTNTILVNATTPNVFVSECGWDASSTSSTTSHQADNRRSSSLTVVWFDAGSGSTLSPDLVWMLLNSAGGDDAAAASLYNDVTVYADDSFLGSLWSDWDGGAAESYSVSDRPAEPENTIQAADASATSGRRFWAVFWRHEDDHASHQIGVLRGAAAVSSSTSTVREVDDHQLFQRTSARTLENQHPVRLLSEWRMTVELDRWAAADYRSFKIGAERHGPEEGLVFALRWTDITGGSLNIDDEADKGFIFYGTLVSSSSDGHNSKGSENMTGDLSFAQLRGPQ